MGGGDEVWSKDFIFCGFVFNTNDLRFCTVFIEVKSFLNLAFNMDFIIFWYIEH